MTKVNQEQVAIAFATQAKLPAKMGKAHAPNRGAKNGDAMTIRTVLKFRQSVWKNFVKSSELVPHRVEV